MSAIMLAWSGKKLHVSRKKICCRPFFFAILNLMQSPRSKMGRMVSRCLINITAILK